MKKKFLIVFLICCMMFGVASPAFAYEPASNWVNYLIIDAVFPSASNNYPHDTFAVYTTEDSNVKFNVVLDDTDNVTNIIVQSGGSYIGFAVYSLFEGEYMWVGLGTTNGNFDFSEYSISGFDINSIQSSLPLYIYGTDEVFTPPPLTLEQVTVAQIQGAQTILPILDGSLQTLVPFGIICLALLVGLVLLRKIFRIFQR